MLLAIPTLVVSVSISALAIQVPSLDSNQAILGDEGLSGWHLARPPDPNGTDQLVFETVFSLLQHWPNTRMRNGHTVVPGVIPTGTVLYHGRINHELPPGPDWLATDPEHSYLFCREIWDRMPGHVPRGCWHLTVATTRPLKVVYFDGSSAAKTTTGSMDTGDLFAWGEINTGNMHVELKLITDLCEWGTAFGVDGFVRMEMDFEVMLCDFTSGVRVVSFANLPDRLGVPRSMAPYIQFEVMNSGSWHNHFPGETRVKLDLAGLVSFYDTQLAPSLVAIRAGQERWDHRVANISTEDLAGLKLRLETALLRPKGLSSGIDWRTLIQVIVDRFAGRLELTRHLLNSSTTEPNELIDLANKTQTQLRVMLTPYILLSATPTGPFCLTDKSDLEWARPIYKECATTHTRILESELDSMTESEKSLLQAVRGTSREICRVVTKMWTAGVYAGIDPSLNTRESPDVAEVAQVWTSWGKELNQLMGWLDWSVWVKCNPECGLEEMCYLPTWPIGFPRTRRGGPPPPPDPNSPPPERLTSFDWRNMAMESLADEMANVVRPEPDEWIRPQPRCVQRVVPNLRMEPF